MTTIGFNPKFIVDTGRNGVTDMRDNCANWCNIRDAGVGSFPTTNTGHDTLMHSSGLRRQVSLMDALNFSQTAHSAQDSMTCVVQATHLGHSLMNHVLQKLVTGSTIRSSNLL